MPVYMSGGIHTPHALIRTTDDRGCTHGLQYKNGSRLSRAVCVFRFTWFIRLLSTCQSSSHVNVQTHSKCETCGEVFTVLQLQWERVMVMQGKKQEDQTAACLFYLSNEQSATLFNALEFTQRPVHPMGEFNSQPCSFWERIGLMVIQSWISFLSLCVCVCVCDGALGGSAH